MNKYQESLDLHNVLVSMGRIVRLNTSGEVWWVEYADRFSGKWKRI
jgi:N-glycosylase/DNA lyase